MRQKSRPAAVAAPELVDDAALLGRIQELYDALANDEYVEYGSGYDPDYGEYRGFGDDSWIDEMDGLFAAATSLYRAGNCGQSHPTAWTLLALKRQHKLDAPMSQPPHSQFLVVGIGASAGGLEALQTFFTHLPADSGCAYVVILHRSPDHDSQLAALLQAVAPIPVAVVTERRRVEPNHVYVVPPDQHLSMLDGELRISPNVEPEDRRAPVDIFFRTLADSHDGRGVCVILSGSGSDGSMGLKRVKERGGVVFVQNPREALFAEMPRTAIATDLVDDVLPVADIPARIVAYRDSLGTVVIPEEPAQRPEAQQQALRELFALLRTRTGHDFANYKRPTLLRRIERRINVHRLPDLPAYAAFLNDHPDEVQALLKDLLISVTNFFRDKETFAALEQEVLPRLFAGKGPGDQVRVWVVGCATGEEAYSVAMLCAERVIDVLDAPEVQVFATDIDEAALAHARAGLYTASDVADVSPERLRRFFTREDERYRVRGELRDLILFATHNVLSDPPFAHVDLVTCRNVLIYLNNTAQERVIETFHFALNPGGSLFLGSVESTDGASDLFEPLSREQRLFLRRPVSPRPLPIPPVGQLTRPAPPRSPALLSVPAESGDPARAQLSLSSLHQRLLEQYAPPSLVVNEEFEIVHLSERAGRYLQFTGGAPTVNLLQVVRPELRSALNSALYQALQRQTNVDTPALSIRIDERSELVTVRIRPTLWPDAPVQGLLLVLFEPGAVPAGDAELVVRSEAGVSQPLEAEIARLKLQLRLSSEQYEYQAEELKATNEELLALNEELRSSSEELHTSKEELQSVNEELRTVNQELKVKVEEATQTSANLQNLVNSTDIATIFLDRQLRIKLYTPAARELYNLIAADYGRPLADLTHQLHNIDVYAEAQRVLATLQMVEHEVQAADGRVYVLRILPYRVAEDRIGGVVLTFFDITERSQAQVAQRASEERQSFLLKLSDALRGLDDPVAVQATASRVLGEHLQSDRAYYVEIDEAKQEFVVARDWHRPGAPSHARRYPLDDWPMPWLIDGKTWVVRDVDVDSAMPDDQRESYRGNDIGATIVVPLIKGGRLVATFVTNQRAPRPWTAGEVALVEETAERTWAAVERARAEAALRESEAKYRSLFTLIDDGFCIIERVAGEPLDFRYLEANPAFVTHSGIPDVVGKTIRQVVPGEPEEWFEVYERVLTTGEAVRLERGLGTVGRVLELSAFPVAGAADTHLAVIFKDITERKRREANQELLVTISERLSRLSDEEEIIRAVGVQLADHLQLTCYHYVDVDEERAEVTLHSLWHALEVPDIRGTYPIDGFIPPDRLQKLRAGESSIINDVENDVPVESAAVAGLKAGAAAQQISAYVAVPYSQDGRWKAYFAVADSRPRRWTGLDIELIQEVASYAFPRIERARAEAALRTSEERYRTLFNSMDEAYAVVEVLADEQGTWHDFLFLDANPAFIEHTAMPYPVGKTATELLGTPNPRWAQIYGTVVETGEAVRVEETEPLLRRVFDLNVFRLGGPGSRRVAVLFTNITARKEAEAERERLLREAELARADADLERRRLLAVLEQLPVGVHVADVPGGRLVFDNAAVRAICGEAPLSTSVADYSQDYAGHYPTGHPRAGEALASHEWPLARTIATGAPAAEELVEIRRADGTRRLASINAVPVRDADERVVGAVATSVDVTDMKRAEEALRASEEKYRTLFDTMAEGFTICGALRDGAGQVVDLRYLEVNRALEQQTGLDRRTLLGRKLSEVLPPADLERWNAIYAGALDSGEPAAFEEYVVLLDRWFAVSMYPRPGDELAVFYRDITERKRHEQRQAFLLKLSDALRAEPDADAVANRALQLLSEQLQLDRCWLSQVFDGQGISTVGPERIRPDLPPMAGVFQLSDYPETMRQLATQPMVIHDAADDPRFSGSEKALLAQLHLRALLVAPLRKGQQQIIWALAAAMATPRSWTEVERVLLEEVAERMWVAMERARAEEALRETEGRLRALVENLPGGAAFIVGHDLRYLLAEGEALRAVGSTPEQYIGKTIYEMLEAHQVAEHEVRYRQAFAGEPFTHEHQVDDRSFLSRGVPLRKANNDIYAVLVVSYDISDRKRAEASLRESETRFRTLADTVPQLIWTNDTDGQAIYFNQRWYDYSGLSEEQSIGPGWQAIVHPDDEAGSAGRWQQALSTGDTFESEYRLRGADGVYRWHLGRNVPLRAEAGAIIGWFGSATDIEALKQAEAARYESALLRRLAVAQEEERLRIARDLHDQLGQLITGLLLHLKQVEAAAQGTAVAPLLPPVQALIIDMAKEAHRIAMNLRPTALEDVGLIPALDRLVADWNAQSGVPAAFESQGLGERRLPQPVEVALFRVAQEALTNVQKHAAATRVSVTVQRLGELVVLVVEDNGRGFDLEAPATDERPRLGVLGMRERVGQIGGTLEIESTPGSGTTLLVRVPLAVTMAPPAG